MSYYQKPESNKSVLRISKPKTEAGIRTIPMLDVVKDSFEMLYEEQLENGFNETEIDGMSGFIFVIVLEWFQIHKQSIIRLSV